MMESKKANKPISFEINLVPDIKGEVLKKRKLQVWVIAICVLLSGACAAVILFMVSILGVQGLQLKGIDDEIACRSEGGKGDCSKFGIPISETKDLDSLLTIKSEMDGLAKINEQKTSYARIFELLPVIAMRDADEDADGPSIEFSSVNLEYGDTTADLSFDVKAYDHSSDPLRGNIAFKTAERFEKTLPKIYYDYGRYMRTDKDGNAVEIPDYCILGEFEDDRGIRYGIYAKGIPGCEKEMTRPKTAKKIEGAEEEEIDDVYSLNGNISYLDCGQYEITCYLIRRTYIDSEDKESYKTGKDTLSSDDFSIAELDEELANLGLSSMDETKLVRSGLNGFYFESECIGFNSEGKIDEDGALSKCPLISSDTDMSDVVSEASQSVDQSTGLSSADFNVNLSLDMSIFRKSTKHVAFYGPSRRNVTDSYVKIRDMYNQKTSEESE